MPDKALGSLLPAIMVLNLTEEQMHTWGWRIPLLLALPMGVIGLYIRSKLAETPHFEALKAERARSANPVVSVLSGSEQRRLLLRAFLLIAVDAGSFYMIVGYLPSFATTSLGLSGWQAFAPSIIALTACTIAMVIAARLSDRAGRKRVLAFSAAGLFLFSFPIFLLITSGAFGLIVVGLVLFGVLAGPCASIINPTIIEMFPTRVRVSGHGITYNLSVALFGGSAPYVLTWLGGVTGSAMVGEFYIMVLAVVSLPAIIGLVETARRPLR